MAQQRVDEDDEDLDALFTRAQAMSVGCEHRTVLRWHRDLIRRLHGELAVLGITVAPGMCMPWMQGAPPMISGSTVI